MLLPSDLQIELEYWAETGEFDEDELHEVRYYRPVLTKPFQHDSLQYTQI